MAPVISMSYGLCEQADMVDLPGYQAVAQQANAQGITWLNAAGDAGATDCEDSRRAYRPERIRGGRAGIHSGDHRDGRDRNQRHGRLLLGRQQRRQPGLGLVLHSGAGLERYRLGRRTGFDRRGRQCLLFAAVLAKSSGPAQRQLPARARSFTQLFAESRRLLRDQR